MTDARVVDGRFELLERLGGGGTGTVWRARDLVLHRDVALKEVRPQGADEDTEGFRALRARVLREARGLARVDHPNVFTIHHIVDGGPDTYPWLVMELITGGSLQDRLDRGRMTPGGAAGLGRELLAALVAAHGIEHHDVKPANVLLRSDGRAVLTGFGFAALQDSTRLTATGSIISSPDYMSPERAHGESSGPPADLWSLGMLLYVAVEGRHPLRRDSTPATLAAVLHEDVPRPRHAGALTDVLMSLLVHDPEARLDARTLDRELGGVSRELVEGAPVPGDGEVADAVPTSFRITAPEPGPRPRNPPPGPLGLLKHPYRGSHRPSRGGRAAGPCRYAWRRHPARRVATMRPASARS